LESPLNLMEEPSHFYNTFINIIDFHQVETHIFKVQWIENMIRPLSSVTSLYHLTVTYNHTIL